MSPRVDRRRFLGGAGLLGAGLGAGAVGADVLADRRSPVERARAAAVAAVRPATSGLQVGIADRQPACLLASAYDLPAGDSAATRRALAAVLRGWTAEIAQLAAGGGPVTAGLGPAGVTATVGLGASALHRAGLVVPAALAPIPAFTGDRLEPARSDGDLLVQVCAEDPMVAFAAARRLGRVGGVLPRWSQRGFLRTAAAADRPDATPRNLMGQVDGTDNPAPGSAQFDIAVTVTSGPSWLVGGSYLVCRRIRMLLDSWDRLSRDGQEQVIGRRLTDGAPLSGGTEHTTPNFGTGAIAGNAHVRLTHPQFNDGVQMFRRGYAYDDGPADAGLFFQAFQADPRTAFVPIQRKLATSDALTPFLRHTAGALFAIPPAARPGGFLAEALVNA